MKILENNAIKAAPQIPLKVRCPHCNSLLLIERGDCRKKCDWTYTSDGKPKKYGWYVVDCPCCNEEFNVKDYENIRTARNSRAL